MSYSAASPVHRFDNRVAQRALALFSLVIVFIGLGGVSAAESRGQGIVFLVLGLISFGRAVRSSNVDVGIAEVVTRSIVSTRHYSFDDLIGVEVRIGRTGLNGFGREHLVFHCADGSERAFTELNCRPSQGAQSIVQRAAACIEQRLNEG